MQNAKRNSLATVEIVRLSRRVLVETVRALQNFGSEGNEGLVLWVGLIEDAVATIQGTLIPPQESIRSEEGVGYFVTTETLFSLNRFLSEKRLRLIAQIHSHPTEAYHSETDDRYAIVTTEGGFSLVVPYFARTAHTLPEWAIYRLRNAQWLEIPVKDTQRIFQVVD
ncbi:MAG: Mov34/MPN/PAD-1 family protein [Hyalangium sp.]|uniref:Mov34/MPN/PAD-1 family protein n=1 Tax=Hyalangium sp. TaxID=2028555 RepID=UPI00389B273F